MGRKTFDKALKEWVWKDIEDELLEPVVPTDVFEYAYWLRAGMTALEKQVWTFLGKEENRWRYLRQWPVRVEGKWLYLDFFEQGYNTALEVDGPDHVNTVEHDRQRDLKLRKLGIRVFHITPAHFRRYQKSQLYQFLTNFIENYEDLRDTPGITTEPYLGKDKKAGAPSPDGGGVSPVAGAGGHNAKDGGQRKGSGKAGQGERADASHRQPDAPLQVGLPATPDDSSGGRQHKRGVLRLRKRPPSRAGRKKAGKRG